MVSHDRGSLFFGLILPHGLLELTAIFVAAAVGLRLFWSWIEPGPRSRLDSLAAEGRTAAGVALGLVVVLFAREAFMGVVVLVAKRYGWTGLPVHFIGKAATFNLLYSFPALLMADGDGALAAFMRPVGWGFAWWGTVLYWVAGILYAVQLRRLIAHRGDR